MAILLQFQSKMKILLVINYYIIDGYYIGIYSNNFVYLANNFFSENKKQLKLQFN